MVDANEQVALDIVKKGQQALSNGQDELAVSLFAQARKCISESSSHELQMDVLYLWSQALYLSGDRRKGLEGMESLVEQSKAIIPQDSARLLVYLGVLHITYVMEQKTSKAIAIQHELMPLIMEQLTEGNFRAARALDEIVEAQNSFDMLGCEEIDRLMGKACAVVANNIGEENKVFVFILNVYAKYLYYIDNSKEAMFMFGNAYAKSKSLFGENHELTENIKANFEDVLKAYRAEMIIAKN